MTMCWLFGDLFLRTNHGRCLPLSANSEWDSLMTMSPNPNRGELKRNGLSNATILGYYYSRLTASVSHLETFMALSLDYGSQPYSELPFAQFFDTTYILLNKAWLILFSEFYSSFLTIYSATTQNIRPEFNTHW